jgi:hypothetical protein
MENGDERMMIQTEYNSIPPTTCTTVSVFASNHRSLPRVACSIYNGMLLLLLFYSFETPQQS